MQILCIRNILVISIIPLFIAGCAGSGDVTKDPGNTKIEKTPAPVISPEAQKDYDAALEAIRGGKKGKAKSLLKTLSAAYPELSGPHTNLGLLFFHEGKIDEAEQAFLQATKVNPQSAVSYNHLGIINRGKGNFKEARSNYEKALQIDKNYAYAHLNYGILLDLYVGELKLALKHYKRYQKLNGKEDAEVKKWIVDLERRIKRAK